MRGHIGPSPALSVVLTDSITVGVSFGTATSAPSMLFGIPVVDHLRWPAPLAGPETSLLEQLTVAEVDLASPAAPDRARREFPCGPTRTSRSAVLPEAEWC